MVDGTTQNSLANVWQIMTSFYSDMQPAPGWWTLSKYSPITLHLSPSTRILNENPTKEYSSPPLPLNCDYWVVETQKFCC